MINKILIPNGSEAVEAMYNEQVVEEYRDNPFIESLPPILKEYEAVEKLAIYPNYNPQERLLDKQYRIHIVQRLFQCFQPLMIHLDLESRISRVIRQGYLARNPFKPTFALSLQEGYNQIYGLHRDINSNSIFRTTAAGFTILGVSGMGKTTAINRVLSLYPQVIVHKNYKEINFSMYQVVWLKLDCPFDGSLKGLCIEFFNKLDDILGSNYSKKYSIGRITVDNMLSVMSQVARNIGLGLLIIDEIQHLSRAKSGGDQKMLNFFVTLVNTIGVPVILVGTPAGLSILQSEFRQARRGSGQGDMIWERLNMDQNWDLLVNAVWEYQWTKKQTPLTLELVNLFYEESQGIIDIFIKLYVMSQIQAIVDGTELITPQTIKQVASKHLQLVKPFLNALKNNDVRKLSSFGDLCTVDINFSDFMNKEKASVDLQMKVDALKRTQRKKEQERQVSLKEQAILKLIDLEMETEISQAAVEKVMEEKNNLDVNEIVIKVIQSISTSEKQKNKRKKMEIPVDNDLRDLVVEGRKENKTVYEIFEEKDYIKSYENDFCKVV